MAKNLHRAVWYLFTTLVSIFSICTIRIFHGYHLPFYAVTANAICSLGGLVFHMHVDQTAQKRPGMKAVRLLLLLNSVSVFLMFAFSLFILTSQYHNPLQADRRVSSAAEIEQVLENPAGGVEVLETEDFYIYCVDYDSLAFAAGDRPSQDDPENRLCVAAAFQSTYQLDFHHSNIVGWHTSGGQLERGKPQERLGAFTYVDGEARIWNIDEAEEAVRRAAEQGGMGYQQFILFCDGERGGFRSDEFRCLRALAVLGGKACIIDTRTQMYYNDFVQALEDLGIRNALYCDMGSGWNYSWYRNADGMPVSMIGTPWPFSHNWLVFR